MFLLRLIQLIPVSSVQLSQLTHIFPGYCYVVILFISDAFHKCGTPLAPLVSDLCYLCSLMGSELLI
jgi:hypothetical protein